MIRLFSLRITYETRLGSKLKLRSWIMPKNRSYIPDLQKNRRKHQENKIQKADGPAYLQFLGSGAVGAPRSIYFFTDYNRYIFNVGEGTQRIAHENGVKIARLEHVFITYPVWENVGGLLGMALTVQECGVPELTIHGPEGISDLFAVAQRFVILKDLNIKKADCRMDVPYEDPVVTIHYVPLKSSEIVSNPVNKGTTESAKITEKAGITDIQDILEMNGEIDYYVDESKKQSSRITNSSLSWIAEKVLTVSAEEKCLPHISMVYICRLKPKLGHLNLEACVEKNIPPGPLLGRLKAGEDVTLPDGTLVRAKDVKSPDEPGAVFIVVDCPTVNYLDSLENQEIFKNHQEGAPDNDIPKYVIHFTPASIMQNERYQRWMKKFPKSTLHVNANDSNKCLGLVGCHEMQYKLNLLDSNVFPLLKDDSIPIYKTYVCKTDQEELDHLLMKAERKTADPSFDDSVKRKYLNIPEHEGNTMRCLPLRDVHFARLTDCVYLNPESYIYEVLRDETSSKMLQALRCQINSMSENIEREYQKKFPVITFLGTGSCIPNKCRNTSAILVSLAHDNHILMDCGEGTFGQLIRHFGFVRTEEILACTNIIFISHLHADHHLGLISLLKFRRKAVQKFNSCLQKVFLMAPKPMVFWLHKYQNLFEEILNCISFISNEDLEYRNQKMDIEGLLSSTSLKNIVTCKVRHCSHAYGISFTDLNETKVTYSGDTMPCTDLVQIGKKSNLLIHEATFEDELVQEARIKTHSTFSEAIEIGQRMNAAFTLLTHFSQRYAKLPLINDKFTENVGIAFDHMEVTLSDLPKLHLFNPVLTSIFAEEFENLLQKTTKKKENYRY